MVTATRIFETGLYVRDLDEAERFYTEVLGLEPVQRGEVLIAFRCGDGVLLLFDSEKTSAPGRSVPAHGTTGPGHVAFTARDDELDAWRQRLAQHGVEIESEVEWEVGGRSIYFRDPSGNSLEFAPPTLWGGGWSF